MNFKSIFVSTFSIALTTTLNAQSPNSARYDSASPISIMGDHVHGKGEWMGSYRYMFMEMDGLRQGSDSISAEDAFSQLYTVAPERMTMEMHMLGAMNAITDETTLMIMIPYQEIEMDHLIFGMAAPLIAFNDDSRTFTTRNSGWGDLKISALRSLWRSENTRANYSLGFSLPTGSISQTDEIPGPGGRLHRQMPAPMQLGSGSYEFRPSITIVGEEENWSWGSQANAIIRLNDNSHNYRLGDQVAIEGWVSKALNDRISVSATLGYSWQDDMHGLQRDVSQSLPFAPTRKTVTTAYSDNYGGETLKASIGINYSMKEGILKGDRLGFEIAAPLWQDVNGIQLETDWTATFGWQRSFGGSDSSNGHHHH